MLSEDAVRGNESSERTPLKISTEQLVALHGFFAAAAVVSEDSLTEICGSETRVEVLEIRCTSLGDFGEQGMRLSDDMVAGVIGRLGGAMPGSLNLVVEPEEALLWAQIGNDSDPLGVFVSLGSALLDGFSVALSEILDSSTPFQGAALAEESELVMLLKTHAPSDTLVFSTRLHIEISDEVIAAMSHLLIEPKSLTQLLSALSVVVH